MDDSLREEILSVLTGASDMTIATIRPDGYPQATTVSYVTDGLTIYFGCAAESQKAQNIAYNDKVSLTVTLPYFSWEAIRGLSIGARRNLAVRPGLAKVGNPHLMRSFTGLRHRQMPAPAACLRSHPTLRRDRRSRKRHR